MNGYFYCPPYNSCTVDFFCLFEPKGGLAFDRKYISAVTPLKDNVLQVDFVTGSRLLLDMSRYLDKLRFRPLAKPRGVEQRRYKRHFHPIRERGAQS